MIDKSLFCVCKSQPWKVQSLCSHDTLYQIINIHIFMRRYKTFKVKNISFVLAVCIESASIYIFRNSNECSTETLLLTTCTQKNLIQQHVLQTHNIHKTYSCRKIYIYKVNSKLISEQVQTNARNSKHSTWKINLYKTKIFKQQLVTVKLENYKIQVE